MFTAVAQQSLSRQFDCHQQRFPRVAITPTGLGACCDSICLRSSVNTPCSSTMTGSAWVSFWRRSVLAHSGLCRDMKEFSTTRKTHRLPDDRMIVIGHRQWPCLFITFQPPDHFGRELVLSSVGNSLGIFTVTLPVAAHSVPRCRVTVKPTQRIESAPCPIGVWNTRPSP